MMATIPVSDIEIGRRLRETGEAQVEALVNSIADIGLLNPITVYPRNIVRDGISTDGYGLVAGAHRVEAVKRLGLVEIDAVVVDLGELERQIAECDENLCAPTLTPSQKALFTRRRKEAYEALHPETRHGGDRKSDQADNLSTRSYADDQAERTGVDARTVRRDASRGEKVIEEALEMIRGTKLDTGTYLDKIKKLSPNDQVEAVKRDLAAERRDKAAAKAERESEQAEHDRQREEHNASLPDHVKAREAAKAEAVAQRSASKGDAERIESLQAEIDELREANAALESENTQLKAESAKWEGMRVQYEQGGFEKVVSDLKEEIRVLESRVYAESREKVKNLNSLDWAMKKLRELGWSRDEVIDLDTGETVK